MFDFSMSYNAVKKTDVENVTPKYLSDFLQYENVSCVYESTIENGVCEYKHAFHFASGGIKCTYLFVGKFVSFQTDNIELACSWLTSTEIDVNKFLQSQISNIEISDRWYNF